MVAEVLFAKVPAAVAEPVAARPTVTITYWYGVTFSTEAIVVIYAVEWGPRILVDRVKVVHSSHAKITPQSDNSAGS
jgi:hypothetical protein